MLAAVAFVHQREHRDHVAHRGDVRVPDQGAGACLGRAGGDIGDLGSDQFLVVTGATTR
ncbi:hypothetical protein AB0C40_35470 [Streptomyces brevispora]|uniref:hypothetical protein n=1 Tax=Streptomyces brevispora TaxID=887462 RepID=UPI0033F3462B